MSTVNVVIGYCGVCCDHCAMSTRIPEMAAELMRYITAYGYREWIHNVTREFEFNNLLKGLEWFANSSCQGCKGAGGMPGCEVRVCCSGKKLANCYFCDIFPLCEKLNYQKETYHLEEHFEKIKRLGYDIWLREQEKKIEENFDNIAYLEKGE